MVQNETLEQLLSEQEQLENVEEKKTVRTSAADFSEETATMDDFAEELEASYRRVRPGDVMKGTVISVDEEGVVLDLDYFTPGRVEPDEISDDPNFHYLTDLKNGDTVSATVVSTDDGSGYLLMSIREANRDEAWAKLEKLMRDKRPVKGKITEVVPAGAIMFVEGIRGFIPVSRLATSHVDDTAVYLNQMMEVLVIEADEQERKLILSARELLAQKEIEEKNKKVNRIKVDSVVEGTVEQIKDYGAFVNIGDGLSGLLHISQISEQRIKNPRAVLKEGQSVRVKIIKVENGKISLSMKALADLAAKEEEEVAFEYKEEGEATTGLGSLLAKLKL